MTTRLKCDTCHTKTKWTEIPGLTAQISDTLQEGWGFRRHRGTIYTLCGKCWKNWK
jgi:hypothetical protein